MSVAHLPAPEFTFSGLAGHSLLRPGRRADCSRGNGGATGRDICYVLPLYTMRTYGYPVIRQLLKFVDAPVLPLYQPLDVEIQRSHQD